MHSRALKIENPTFYYTLKISFFKTTPLTTKIVLTSLGLSNCGAIIGEGKAVIFQECQTVTEEVTVSPFSSFPFFFHFPFLPCIHTKP